MHVREVQCYTQPYKSPLTCLHGSTYLRAITYAAVKERVICANLMSQDNFCGQIFEIQTQLGICCITCQFSLHVPQRLQGYQTTAECVLAHRPGVTRAAWTQKSRTVDDEKARPAFSRSRTLQSEKIGHNKFRRAFTAQSRLSAATSRSAGKKSRFHNKFHLADCEENPLRITLPV